MTKKSTVGERKGGTAAFTLIELLVVIAIIAVLAALVIPLSGVATTKMRLARAQAELNNMVTAIESYKLEVGFYPPDNGKLKGINTNTPSGFTEYTNAIKMHPLYYELVGCIFTNRHFYAVGGEENISGTQLDQLFGVSGIQNSQRRRADVPFKGFQPKPGLHATLSPQAFNLGANELEILASPLPGPKGNQIKGKTGMINPWFYDASSTNRHNRQSFDLWIEVLAGGQTNIVGNWKN